MTKSALVLGSSGGIGSALVRRLSDDGWNVTGLSRSDDGFDLTDPASIARAAEGLGDRRFDLIFNATGALVIDGAEPEKTIRSIEADAMAAQFALNATGVALALRYLSPLMRQDGRAIFASISARVGSIDDNRLGGWISYRAAKAAQNQILRTAAVELTRRNPGSIVVALHPGTVETPLSAKYADHNPTITPERSVDALLAVLDRLTPEDSGTFWDWKGERVAW
ncbi:SDR family NAD(P)-dependent oxidoreductase [Paracoccus sp. TK19116]|uniref:SDR family NAD(P)-dependent oxidoreductase n=1 Tax=Paracoccus albicereus TaxID=2922394 RepID=A0ABT1MPP8_9RHOB|nr:SDR family NAD(P)-dependent oxidoreductase [Paracoccus albicereus]MCQ0970267.1 SDR family NAD(P)-dependent oxidoreductase [Paracoccus albicereus]